jgi:hypothetical protein
MTLSCVLYDNDIVIVVIKFDITMSYEFTKLESYLSQPLVTLCRAPTPVTSAVYSLHPCSRPMHGCAREPERWWSPSGGGSKKGEGGVNGESIVLKD